jgi:hypothetical protein
MKTNPSVIKTARKPPTGFEPGGGYPCSLKVSSSVIVGLEPADCPTSVLSHYPSIKLGWAHNFYALIPEVQLQAEQGSLKPLDHHNNLDENPQI